MHMTVRQYLHMRSNKKRKRKSKNNNKKTTNACLRKM